ncbi:hypothetical protein H6P81_015670 [Aristolochia fimbriata]|uniref:Protein kinase domain-containing protein n=1 Tax=Aristolochia fimbriata TaxID=158543 RepID=A0AAV7E662_ARIFI|nr:hypothetical protein H6P81_015670 [Aristolochia fimbriata]
MNFSSRVYNQSAICYSESLGQHIHKLSFEERDSPKKKRDGRISTTKEWVLRSFCTKSKASENNDNSAASAALNQHDHSVPSVAVEQKGKQPENNVLDRREGEPAVFFRQSVIDSHADKFKFCLVGKFSGSRPSLALIREWVGKEWKLTGECSVTLLDSSHVFLRLENQADMLYVWTKRMWFIGGHLMKVLKWTPCFRPSEGEPSLAAIWVSLPLLPLVFFQEDLLFSIASAIGNCKVFTMDEPTRKLTRTNVARVCMEVDLVKELPKRVWIGIGDGGFWQEIQYEKLPSYCKICKLQGHSVQKCKAHGDDRSQEKDKNSTLSGLKYERSKSKRSGSQVQFSLGERDGISPRSQNRDESINGSRKEAGSSCLRSALTQSKGETSCVSNTDHPQSTSQDNFPANGSDAVSRDELEIKEEEYLHEIGAEKVEITEEINPADDCPSEDANDRDIDKGKIIEKEQEELETVSLKNFEKKASKEGDHVNAEIGKRVLGSLLKDEDKEVLSPIISKGSNKSPERGSPSTAARRGVSSKRAFFFWDRKAKRNQTNESSPDQSNGRSSLTEFKYAEVKKMTGSFGSLLGRGGFGTVYKGELPDGRPVAVKVVRFCSARAEEEFVSEVTIIKRTRHPNIVKLLGYSLEGSNGALVYEFAPNGPLDKYIHGHSDDPSKFETLLRIATGVARGLEYLHSGFNIPIVHFDIKPSNILLDESFVPKIGDFGLATPWDLKKSSSTSRVRGTKGYVAPELLHGKFSNKLDVYSYGVMLLEMVVRKKPIDTGAENISGKYLLEWVYGNASREAETGLGRIAGFAEEEGARKLILVGLWCVQAMPVDRPSMSKVLEMLEGETGDLKMPPNPFSSGFFRDIEGREDVASDTK